MNIIYLINKLPNLSLNEKPKINKNIFIKYLLENIEDIEKDELNFILLNEEIDVIIKNNNNYSKKKDNIFSLFSKHFNINYKNSILKIYDIDINNKTNQELKRNYYELIINKSKSFFLKEWIFFLSEFKECILGIALDKMIKKQDLIKEELSNSFESISILIKNNINNITNRISKKYNIINEIIMLLEQKKYYELEILLEKMKWKEINKIFDLDDNFTRNNIFQYYYKLQIIERIISFDKIKGNKIFEEILKI